MKITASDLMQKVIQKFLSDNRDLLALVKSSSIDELRQKLSAVMQLTPEFTEEIMLHSEQSYLNQFGAAGREAREAFSRAAYKSVCQCFLQVQRNCQVIFNCRWENFPEAFAQLDAIAVAAGEKEATPPPPPPKSQTELLEEQVVSDYATLSADKMHANLRTDKAYRDTFTRLSESGKLESRVTTLHDGAA